MKITISVLFLASVIMLSACKKDETNTYECSTINPTNNNDVKTIIDANCATSGCHSATSRANGIDLSTYALVKSESENARFLGSIEHQSDYDNMPQSAAKLSDANITTIACWIEQGAVE